MTEREKYLNELKFEGDGIVRGTIGISHPVFKEYGSRLDALGLEKLSPYVKVEIGREPGARAFSEVTDAWGCRWIYPLDSLDGQVIGHPVRDWSQLKSYVPPDPAKFTDWEKAGADLAKTKAGGNVAWGGTDHGGIFLRLTYLRGYEEFMMDVASEDPRLDELIGIVENYWFEVVKRWVAAGADIIGFGDDLGWQRALPMSPAAWRRHIGAPYRRIFQYCRSRGVDIGMHTDGYIVDIIPDLIDCGVSSLNPQDLVNGLDNLARLAKGKVHINLDVDRQTITVFGTPARIEDHILDCVKRLGSPRGGLSFIWGVYPPTPLENIRAVAGAMAKYALYWQSSAGDKP